MNVLVTGGAGFIGSHTVKKLKLSGHTPVVLDNLSRGHKSVVTDVLKVPFFEGSINNRELVTQVIRSHNISAVMHFSAFAYVGESVKEPLKYYENNVSQTVTLLETLLKENVKKFIFSSSCATYGIPATVPIKENDPQNPINPYGHTKLVVEKILCDLALTHDFSPVIFRYFNAAGSDPENEIGELHLPETHLIPLALMAVLKPGPPLSVFGGDYPTPDGTCIRDYLHVNDIADAHITGLQHFRPGTAESYNLGNGKGYSVKEVISAVERITGKKVPHTISPRRPGDPPVLVADPKKAASALGWQPRFPDLDTMVSHCWNWLKNNQNNL